MGRASRMALVVAAVALPLAVVIGSYALVGGDRAPRVPEQVRVGVSPGPVTRSPVPGPTDIGPTSRPPEPSPGDAGHVPPPPPVDDDADDRDDRPDGD